MEFTASIANLAKYNAGVLSDTFLSFPATTEQVQAALREIGVDGLRYEEIIVLEYSVGIKGVATGLGEFAHIDELNYLASRISELSPEEMEKFSAAIECGEYASNIEDLINLTYNLDHYEIYPVHTPEEYGRWLIEKMGQIQLPEAAKDFFDYEAYGEAAAINEGGTFTASGYVLGGYGTFQKVYDGQHVPERYKVFQYPLRSKVDRAVRSVRDHGRPIHKRP